MFRFTVTFLCLVAPYVSMAVGHQPPEIYNYLILGDYELAYNRSIARLSESKTRQDSVSSLLGAGYAAYYLDRMDTLKQILDLAEMKAEGRSTIEDLQRLRVNYYYGRYRLDSALLVMKDLLVSHRTVQTMSPSYYYDLNNFITLIVFQHSLEPTRSSIETHRLLRDDIVESLEQKDMLKDSLFWGSILLNRGLFRYFFEHDSDGAIDDLQEVVTLAQAGRYKSLLADAYGWMGHIYVLNGDVAALDYLQRSKQESLRCAHTGNRAARRASLVHTYYNLMLFYSNIHNQQDSAIYYGGEAERLSGHSPCRLRVNVADQMIRIYLDRKDVDGAAYYYKVKMTFDDGNYEIKSDLLRRIASEKEQQAALFNRMPARQSKSWWLWALLVLFGIGMAFTITYTFFVVGRA